MPQSKPISWIFIFFIMIFLFLKMVLLFTVSLKNSSMIIKVFPLIFLNFKW